MSRRGSSLSYLFGGDADEEKKKIRSNGTEKKKNDDAIPAGIRQTKASSNSYASGSNQVTYISTFLTV